MRAQSQLWKDETAGAGEIPSREEIPAADTWDLTRLYETPEQWEAEHRALSELYPSIASFKGRLGESAAAIRDCLEFDKQLNQRLERLSHYAMLRVSEDSSSDENLRREGQLHGLLTSVNEASAFVRPELQAIGDEQWKAFLADRVLEEWQVPLQRLRRMKPHTLSEAEERLLALSWKALRGHRETFSQLTNVDMKFGTVKDEEGTERPLSQSSLSSFLVSRDREVRRTAFHRFYDEIEDHRYTLASALASSVRGDVFSARARKHPSALEAALFEDDVPVDVYDNLIATVRAHLPALYRYYELRRRVLELDEVHHYDTYVPMVGDMKVRTSFDEACEMVLESLEPLGSEYTGTLREGLQSRWVDRYESRRKRSGAFSSGSYGSPPFILMNYKADVFSDVYTLAHEAGHSMHTWFSQQHQPFQVYDYPIFLAEVASTFNEELLTHHLLEKTDDPRMRAYIINRQIDDIRGTVYRQTMFAEFEKIAHAMEESGEAVTLDSLRQVYRQLLNDYFGEAFAIDEQLELECLRIPHFYSAFYVYKYATGISAAVALAQRVLEGGASETEDYLGFLRSGGSQFPLPTLARAGVDMSQPGPIAHTLRIFEQRVAELEELLLS